MARIGFLGLGNMGMPMASNLLNSGHQLKVFDLVPEFVKTIAKQGAQSCDSIAECCQNVDFIITVLPTTESVIECYNSEQGIFAHANKNNLLIDCSTIDVSATREIQKAAKDKGFNLIDAPISGGVVGAKAATLTFMVGAEKSDFERAKPILESMGKKVIHAGIGGNGQAAKICNNLILGISMIGVAEGFKLAEKLGLDPEVFFQISSNASGACWAMNTNCPYPNLTPTSAANNDYQGGFASAMMLKDLKLSQNAAASVNITTKLGAKATELYQQLNELGYSKLDFGSVIKISGEQS